MFLFKIKTKFLVNFKCILIINFPMTDKQEKEEINFYF